MLFLIASWLVSQSSIGQITDSIDFHSLTGLYQYSKCVVSKDAAFLLFSIGSGQSHDPEEKVFLINIADKKKISQFKYDRTFKSYDIAISPDNSKIACYVNDNFGQTSSMVNKKILIWDVFTGKLICEKKTDNWFSILTFSPDSRFLAFGSDDKNEIKVINSNDGKNYNRIDLGFNTKYVFSNDWRYIANNFDDSKITVWDLNSKSLFKSISCDNCIIQNFIYSNDGNYIFCGTKSAFRLYRIKDGNLVMKSNRDNSLQSSVNNFSISNNSNLFLYNETILTFDEIKKKDKFVNTVYLYDIKNKCPIDSIIGSFQNVFFNNTDDKAILVSSDKLYFWDFSKKLLSVTKNELSVNNTSTANSISHGDPINTGKNTTNALYNNDQLQSKVIYQGSNDSKQKFITINTNNGTCSFPEIYSRTFDGLCKTYSYHWSGGITQNKYCSGYGKLEVYSDLENDPNCLKLFGNSTIKTLIFQYIGEIANGKFQGRGQCGWNYRRDIGAFQEFRKGNFINGLQIDGAIIEPGENNPHVAFDQEKKRFFNSYTATSTGTFQDGDINEGIIYYDNGDYIVGKFIKHGLSTKDCYYYSSSKDTYAQGSYMNLGGGNAFYPGVNNIYSAGKKIDEMFKIKDNQSITTKKGSLGAVIFSIGVGIIAYDIISEFFESKTSSTSSSSTSDNTIPDNSSSSSTSNSNNNSTSRAQYLTSNGCTYNFIKSTTVKRCGVEFTGYSINCSTYGSYTIFHYTGGHGVDCVGNKDDGWYIDDGIFGFSEVYCDKNAPFEIAAKAACLCK